MRIPLLVLLAWTTAACESEAPDGLFTGFRRCELPNTVVVTFDLDLDITADGAEFTATGELHDPEAEGPFTDDGVPDPVEIRDGAVEDVVLQFHLVETDLENGATYEPRFYTGEFDAQTATAADESDACLIELERWN